jgi:hypothetical protein
LGLNYKDKEDTKKEKIEKKRGTNKYSRVNDDNPLYYIYNHSPEDVFYVLQTYGERLRRKNWEYLLNVNW